MSKIRPLDAALDIQVGDARTKLVLIIMARRGNRSGFCYMSQKSIAYEANCSITSVARAIKALIGRGLLEEHTRARGSRKTKTYRLCITPDQDSQYDGSEASY